jgi:hypothetical protein
MLSHTRSARYRILFNSEWQCLILCQHIRQHIPLRPNQPAPTTHHQCKLLYANNYLVFTKDHYLRTSVRHTSSEPRSLERYKSLATSPLHLTIIPSQLSSITRPLHLPNMQQSIFTAQQPSYPQSQPHRREALQVPSSRLQQSI